MDDLQSLNNFKNLYAISLKHDDLVSNVTSSIKDKIGHPEGESATLLYFYEKFFNDIWFQQETTEEYSGAEKEFCKDWIKLRVPSSIIKNIKYEKLRIPSNILRTIYELTKRGDLIYSSFVSKIFFRFEKRGLKREQEISREIKEGISDAFLKNNLNKFSSYLLPRKGGYVVFSKEAETILYNLINEWRFSEMGLRDEELKNLKSVARIVATVANKGHIGILYKIDKARDSNDMLNGLRELSKRVLGLEDKEREKIYPPALESLVETLEKNKDNRELFEDIKNVLVTFSCVEISKIKRRRVQNE